MSQPHNNQSYWQIHQQGQAYLQQQSIIKPKLIIQNKTNNYQKLSAYSSQLLYLMLITTFFTVMGSLIPNYLMVISVGLHVLDFFLVSSFLLIVNSVFEFVQRKKYRNIKTYWHYFIYFGIYKYISIVNNNTRYLYATQSHTYIPNILYNYYIQHIIYSLILYFSYIYSTGRTNLTTNKYVCIVGMFIATQILIFRSFGSQMFHVFGYIGLIVLYRAGWGKEYDVGIFKFLFKQDIIYKVNLGNSKYDMFKRFLNKIIQHPIFSSSQKIHTIIWLILSIAYLLYLVTKQCRQYWHWMIIWICSIILGRAKQIDLQYVKNRYTNILWAGILVFLGNIFFVVFNSSHDIFSCNFVGEGLNFHINNLICLILIGVYLILEDHVTEKKYNGFVEGFLSICVQTIDNPNPNQIVPQNPDKPYTISIVLLKHIVLILTIFQLITTYLIYSYKYHYHNIKSTQIQQQPHLINYNYTGDDNYSIYQNSCFGYILVGFWGLFSWVLYRMAVLYAVQRSGFVEGAINVDDRYVIQGFYYCHSYRKILIKTLILTFLLTLTCIISQFSSIIANIVAKIKHFTLIHPKCPIIQQFYKTSNHLNNCNITLKRVPIILIILCMLIMIYWIIKRRIKAMKIFNNSYLTKLAIVLYWTCLSSFCMIGIYGLTNWECFHLGDWIYLYLLGMIFSIINVIYSDFSRFKYKQY